ncbi:putative mitochondrial protein [Symbiodinium microadriaticum]|uniref:Putative mitochondrial protein n=1 Tax=Symbiodinium microadriaticum TaxID=2951 RepID=A0A1Q9D5G5_SYMMI|nr:putative mitochondrial protein [Symbiodinium microadriaticum]
MLLPPVTSHDMPSLVEEHGTCLRNKTSKDLEKLIETEEPFFLQEEPSMPAGDWYQYWDDVNGGFLLRQDGNAEEAMEQSSFTRTIGIEVEGSKRHAELLIEELGLKNGKGVETADVKKSVDQELLEAKGKMVMPTEADWANLKRLGRYLKQCPYAKLVCEAQKEPDKLRVQVDADHAGDAVTRRSTTGMIAFYGRHPIKHASNVQSTIALSTGESEYYALVKVPGERNTSDILTKSVGGPTLRKHLKVLGYRLTSTKDVGHKELLY